MKNNRIAIKPFLKWAGGKRWLVQRYDNILPEKYDAYYEPFLGSGAIFFNVQPKRAILSDTNKELIETYLVIRDDWRSVLDRLLKHQEYHSTSYYYKIRATSPKSPISRAARFIYLNRTCWNGLYRVNLKGIFNVPKGTKTTVVFPDDNFEAIARVLKNCVIISEDFATVIDRAKKNDLIYVDPPYTVKHYNNNFLKYNEKIFSWHDQIRLAKTLHEAHRRGVKITMSNADHECIKKLYNDFKEIHIISRYSVIAADSSKRKHTTELLVTNYKIRSIHNLIASKQRN